ncbi:MAG: alpha/beta hydrolase [Phycisphaeraceae bacterium]
MPAHPIMTPPLSCLFAWVLLFGLSAAARAEDLKPGEPERIVFKQTTDAKGEPVELKLHVFKPEGWKADDQRPVAVFFFGGGWVSGNPRQFYPHCRDLAALGMVAIAAEYRIRNAHGTTPLACVEDGKSAVRHLRRHARKLGIDPNRIVSAGGSAGGHVAACTGIVKGFDSEDEDLEVSSVPNLMILFNPVISTSRNNGYGSNRVPGDDPTVISPLHKAHKGQPPCIIFHGDADTVVKIDAVRAFDRRCDELGAVCKVIEYEGAGHGFFNHRDFKKPKKDSPDYYTLTMKEAVAFLADHGYVKADDE